MYRFPYMIVAQMSRDSVMRSAEYGITAKQILHYLENKISPNGEKRVTQSKGQAKKRSIERCSNSEMVESEASNYAKKKKSKTRKASRKEGK